MSELWNKKLLELSILNLDLIDSLTIKKSDSRLSEINSKYGDIVEKNRGQKRNKLDRKNTRFVWFIRADGSIFKLDLVERNILRKY